MAKPMSNPFLEMDMSKIMSMSPMMDMSKMMDFAKSMPMMDMSKMMEMAKSMPMPMQMPEMMQSMAMPNMDMESMMSVWRKNVEAVAAANQMMCESGQAIVQGQVDMARQGFETMSGMMQSMMATQNPSERMAKQAEATKTVMDRCITGMKDMTDTVARNQYQAMEVMGTRVCEGLDEMQRCMTPTGKANAA